MRTIPRAAEKPTTEPSIPQPRPLFLGVLTAAVGLRAFRIRVISKIELTQARLKELLHYDPETGEFRRLIDKRNRPLVDRQPGACNTQGYRQIRLDGTLYLAHKLAWMYTTGIWPTKIIDHINRDRTDNRRGNLRLAERSENACNSKLNSKNTSGLRGVVWSKGHRKWRAGIRAYGQRIELGLFDDLREAGEAVATARIKAYADFAA